METNTNGFMTTNDEKVLHQSGRMPQKAYVFFCFILSGAFIIAAFAEKQAVWTVSLVIAGCAMAAWGARLKQVERENVCVTEKRLIYYRAGLWNNSSDTEMSIPIEDIAQIRFIKGSVMFGDKISGAVMISLKNGKSVLLPALTEGEYITECVGKRIK